MQGVGIVAAQGGAVEARQVLLERNTEASIRVENVGSSMVIADGIVRDTQSRAEDVGRGVLVRDEGRFEGSRLVVARSRAGGVLVESATATLADVVVRDVESTGDGSEGFGLVTNGESTITADRLLIERARNIGVRIDGPVDVRLSDLAVEDTEPAAADGAGGHGLAVYGGANVQLSRALVAGCAMAGINVGAATLHAEDVVVRDMVPSNLDPPASHGLVVQTEGRVDMTRARFERCIGTGVLVINERGSLDFSDLAIMETASIPGTGTHGHGMHVQGTGTVTGQRLSVTESRGGGVMALLGASIDVQDVVVADTAYPACRETWCEAMGTAYGLTSVDASVRVSRFSVARSALCGVFVGGDVDLAEGAVSEGVIGACVQVDDYDIDRLNSDVVYQDNESNLDVTSLPVPSTF